jgi:poly(3-hydroxyalkanoate) depolymerase
MQFLRRVRAGPEVTTELVTVSGQQMLVSVRHGVGEPVPLLLINGIGASLEALQPFVDAVSPSRTVIRFDPPGVGGSPLPQRPYRFSGLSRLIAGLLSHLGHESADVLGISWGGGVAQHFAAFQSGRCRRLVLVSTATGSLMVPARPGVLARMATPRRYTDAGYLGRAAPSLYGGSARTDPERVTAHLNGNNHFASPKGYLYQLGAAAGWTSVPFLPFLRQPTLIVSGDDDPIIPLANARLMHRLIRDSRLHVFNGGHLGLITEAAELAPVIERFLDEDGTSRPLASRSRHRAAPLAFRALQMVEHRGVHRPGRRTGEEPVHRAGGDHRGRHHYPRRLSAASLRPPSWLRSLLALLGCFNWWLPARSPARCG